MKLRLFVEDYKSGYMNVYDNVKKVKIEKDNNVNCLYYKNNVGYVCVGKLADIKLAFMVDVSGKNCKEYFRYEK